MYGQPLFLPPADLPDIPAPEHAEVPEQDEPAGPPPQRRRGIRRHGRGSVYTDEERAGRIAFLDRIGRRCAANGQTCIKSAANRRLTVIRVDPDTGQVQPGAEAYDVLSCADHTKQWDQNAIYRVLNVEQLPPRTSLRKSLRPKAPTD